jgi:hypothetical protein
LQVKKDIFDFKRLYAGRDAGNLTSQKLIRHFEDRLRVKEQSIEKLEIKNTVLKRKIAQQDAIVKQKEGMGDNLSTIDFDHLQIENQELLEKIESRNTELLALKQATGKTTLQLNGFKQALSKTTAYTTWLHDEKGKKSLVIDKVIGEMHDVGKDLEVERRQNRKLLKDRQEGLAVPPVLEYVSITQEARELKKEIKNWEQRIEVQTGALKLLKRTVRQGIAAHADEYMDGMGWTQ